jgi:hypothetical protein
VLLLLRRCFVKYGSNLLVTLFASTLGKECVAVACLRFTCKSFELASLLRYLKRLIPAASSKMSLLSLPFTEMISLIFPWLIME